MSVAANSPTHGTPSPARFFAAARQPATIARALLFTVLAVALWLVSIDPPDPPNGDLDASWHAAIADAHEHGRAFGTEVIFSAGPMGWLNAHFVTPGSLDAKLAWEFGGKLVLAALVIALAFGLPPVRRGVFIACALLFSRLFPDTLITLVIGLATLEWLLPPETSRWKTAVAIVLLAFLAQLKFTFCMLAGIGVALAIGARLVHRSARGAAALAVGFAAAFVLMWMIAGQNPAGLPAYLRASLQIAGGYPEGMSFDESWPVFISGVVVVLFNAVCAWRLWCATPAGRRLALLPVLLFLAAFWFLAWKHGFTRADGHTLGFFLTCLLIGVAWPGLIPRENRRWWFDATAPLCLVGLGFVEPHLVAQSPGFFRERLVAGGHVVFHPAEMRLRFAAGVTRDRAALDWPQLRAKVGHATIDLLNYEQGLLLVNRLNYHPRPVIQSYSVYTPALMQANAAFFRSPAAPEFVVVRFSSIDERFPAQDDALVLADLPLLYDVAASEPDYVLWRKKTPAGHPPANPVRELVAENSTRLGAEIPLPPDRDHALWMQLDCAPSFIGRLRTFLYRPAQLFMVVTDSKGRELRYRLITAIAREGLLLQPFLETPQDYAAFARGNGRQWLRSIRFEPAAPDEAELWSGDITVRLSRLPGLPISAAVESPLVAAANVANIAPIEMKSGVTLHIFSQEGHVAALVHAPGELVFAPPATMHRLRGRFGITEGAYTGQGVTDGAEFSVEVTRADGSVEAIWRRSIAPLTVPADRGPQTFEVALPAGATRVVLRTGPGPAGRNDWDWTYWTQLEFLP